MQTKIQVDGYGVFEIDSDKVTELISWLSSNQAVSIKPKNQAVHEVISNQYTGRELINEQNK